VATLDEGALRAWVMLHEFFNHAKLTT